jgi:hypothetical protein
VLDHDRIQDAAFAKYNSTRSVVQVATLRAPSQDGPIVLVPAIDSLTGNGFKARVGFRFDCLHQLVHKIQRRHRRSHRHSAPLQNYRDVLACFLEGGIGRQELYVPHVLAKQEENPPMVAPCRVMATGVFDSR